MIDVNTILTQLEGEKEEWLRKSISGFNTKKEPKSRLGWMAQNFPQI